MKNNTAAHAAALTSAGDSPRVRPPAPFLEVIECSATSNPSTQDRADGDGDGTLRPTVFYFRRDLRASLTRDHAVMIGLAVVGELERLRAWVENDVGIACPKFLVSPAEAQEKGWQETEVCHA